MFSTRRLSSGGIVIAVLLTALGVATYFAPGPRAESPIARQRVERGRYLVEQVAMCGDCHTPKDEKGQPIANKALQGAPILLKPSVSIPDWASFAPPIAGLPGYTENQAITFLTIGKTVSGQPSAPPMPNYRFSKEDAAAIIAYLHSLTSASSK